MATSSYLVLPENRLAYESAVAVRDGGPNAKERSGGCLVVCGPTGSGKSSLMKTVFAPPPSEGRSQRRRSGSEDPQLLSAAEWVEEAANADRKGTPADFAAGIGRVKILVLEDIDAFRSRKGRAFADRLCDLLDLRRERGLTTVVTAPAPPGPGLGLTARLTDRLQGGLVTQMQSLSPDSRVRLAVHLASRRALGITEEQLRTIVDLIGESPADVTSALEQIEKLTIRRQSNVDDELLTDFRRRNRPRPPTISAITREVAKEFSAKVGDLRASGRTQAVVLPRQTAMFLARTMANEPYQAIGRYFGNRNHSTVVHSVKRIEQMLDDSAELASRVSSIRSHLAR